MKSMYIGSGDIKDILKGKHTKGFQNFCRKFFSDEIPYYNSFNSPIDALRTGAILEEKYFQMLPDGYYPQYKVSSEEMSVLLATLDFAKIESGKVVDFDELKTCFCTDFLIMQDYKDSEYDEYVSFLKKVSKYKQNYEQVQHQLYVTGLEEANLAYLEVQTYDDEENKKRIILPDEVIKFRIKRDSEVIEKIKERAAFFQHIKDYFKN
ncbi:hypothetical protein M2459_001377 [Parabacteroides sp. PF5-5]|uniref:hypothetical protein n=1 Tax=unclassified Parabacteroides TaxID=2649774 RepID=UPI002473F872|nr:MULTISPECIES: hypothetical protein [unclassified Parabacteroides]MDH6304641.1 hypothetical protein [Parabacteroides sp. PH5-39]MDH6315745.1 hypothetical protein [Parabacteroides sp. PF5-13]MDH6319405.1 hypothetical protein [Parabacteroides sp. PH5-13]MDH6323136.1 hypothetical protein [Parabacteroides sp. PH5-8]MDH6326938.1 hypothetical protein [Parabacteroides sp. PH5-41]